MGNIQEELEAIVQLENYDIVAIMETWWDDLHNWSDAMTVLSSSEAIGKKGEAVWYPCMLGSVSSV